MTPATRWKRGFPTEPRRTRAGVRWRATGYGKKFPAPACPAGHGSAVRRCALPRRAAALSMPARPARNSTTGYGGYSEERRSRRSLSRAGRSTCRTKWATDGPSRSCRPVTALRSAPLSRGSPSRSAASMPARVRKARAVARQSGVRGRGPQGGTAAQGRSASGPAGVEEAEAPRRSRRASAGQDPRAGGPSGTRGGSRR